MKATPIEFRLRYLIHAIIYAIGFVAPWNYAVHFDTIRTWQLLAAWCSRSGLLSFSASTIAVLAAGTSCALLAALLRTWAAAYIGASVVHDSAMHSDRIVAAGPYRHLRNPLYLGTIIHTFALALLMPPTGALFAIILIGLFQLRLIAAEEAFLTHTIGEPYLAYKARVPSLLPSPRSRVDASPAQPAWPTAILGELYMWGVAISFLAFGWRYNSILIMQGVVVSLGVSLIARAFLPKRESAANQASSS